MRPITVSYAPTALDADGIAASQTPGGAGAVTLNGALVSGGVATMAAQQFVTITSAADISNRTFVITGTNYQGATITENLTGPNATTVVSTKSYKTVTSITISGAAAGAITIGVNGYGNSQVVALDTHANPFSVAVAIDVTSATYTIQHTFDNVFGATFDDSTALWFDHDDSTLVGATTDQDGNFAFPVTGVRLKMTVAGSATMTVVQSGGF